MTREVLKRDSRSATRYREVFDMPEVGYAGYHAMAVSALTGHGDPNVLALLPATVPARRVALVGVHAWVEDAYAHVGEWGLTQFSAELRRPRRP